MHVVKRLILVFGMVLLVSAGLWGCGGGDGKTENPTDPTPGETAGNTPGPAGDPVVITIGNLTDLIAVSAEAMAVIDMALDDMVRYFNEKNLIPGIEVRVIKYDTQADQAKDVPGYEWLRGNGADLIWASLPWMAASLKDRVGEEGVVMFVPAADLNDVAPTGYVFCAGIVPQHDAYTLLGWIAEHDWDYAESGPAKVGAAGWQDAYSPPFFVAMEAYCAAHPDQFEWVGAHLTNYSFGWSAEAQALRDCDYVCAPSIPSTFARQYREAGGQAKMLFGDVHTAFMGTFAQADLWDELDGTLVVRTTRWWNERGPLIDLTNEILEKYRPDAADEIRERGSGYMGAAQGWLILEIIRQASDKVGPASIDEAAIFDAARELSVTIDGLERYSFGPLKRAASNYYGVSEVSAEQKDIVWSGVGQRWAAIRYEP